MVGNGSLITLVTGNGSIQHETQIDFRDVRGDLRGLIGLVFRSDEGLCSTVVDDVSQFLAREP